MSKLFQIQRNYQNLNSALHVSKWAFFGECLQQALLFSVIQLAAEIVQSNYGRIWIDTIFHASLALALLYLVALLLVACRYGYLSFGNGLIAIPAAALVFAIGGSMIIQFFATTHLSFGWIGWTILGVYAVAQVALLSRLLGAYRTDHAAWQCHQAGGGAKRFPDFVAEMHRHHRVL